MFGIKPLPTSVAAGFCSCNRTSKSRATAILQNTSNKCHLGFNQRGVNNIERTHVSSDITLSWEVSCLIIVMLPFFIKSPLLVCKVVFYSFIYTRRFFRGWSTEPLTKLVPAVTQEWSTVALLLTSPSIQLSELTSPYQLTLRVQSSHNICTENQVGMSWRKIS